MRKFAIIALLLAMPLLSRAQTTHNSWTALNTLHAGQKVEVVETNLKKHKGTFSSVTDEALQLREGSADVLIERQNVMRVTLLDKSHRLRNALIFGAIGAGAGAGIGAVSVRCPTLDAFCGFDRSIATGLGGVLGLGAGAGIGAATPSHPTIYRIEHH
ncbi:MAG TPA: hypothetical protein VFQ18_06700 [Candidatus Acidoferrum sp.]|nr:hypothetical protein [Candidatus Acidoferrum sp.]